MLLAPLLKELQKQTWENRRKDARIAALQQQVDEAEKKSAQIDALGDVEALSKRRPVWQGHRAGSCYPLPEPPRYRDTGPWSRNPGSRVLLRRLKSTRADNLAEPSITRAPHSVTED